MSCAQQPLFSICPVHYTDQSGFLIVMHNMDVETHFPQSIMEMDDDIPMYKANHPIEESQMQAWMSKGYQTQHKAKQKGWPIPMWQYDLPPKPIPTAYPLTTHIPVVTHIPQDPPFMTDGSWYPDGCCGGCIAITCTHKYQYTLYLVVIPLSLDHPYAVELYVAWILLRITPNLQSVVDHGQWCFKGQTYTDSMSYIQALQAEHDATTPIASNFCRHVVF